MFFQFLEKADFSKLEKAVEWYLKALETGKYFAGIFLIKFLTEAVSVSIYYDYKKNPAQARKRIYEYYSTHCTERKTALDKDSKTFFDFALAFDLFVNEKKDTAILYYHASENFWLKFPPTSEKSKELSGKDFLHSMGMEFHQIPSFEELTEENMFSEENDNTSNFKSKKFFKKISDSKINNFILKNHKVAYPPISRAICQKYYDIVELYLDEKEYPSLDVNIPATNNCYPIHEMLTKCKQSGTTDISNIHAAVRDIDTQLKKLFFKILERTNKDVLSTETNRTKISILQTAIDTLDIEIVQAVLEKMLGEGKFPSNYRITADEHSPLYYAISKKNHLVNPKHFLDIEKNMDGENLVHKNFFAPGFTAEDRKNYYNQMNKLFHNAYEPYKKISDKIPTEEWDESISKIDKIIDLLISKTENVDDFINYPPAAKIVNEHGINALLWACECNDVVTCKKLISAGADITKSVGKIPLLQSPSGELIFLPHNFIYRAINFEAWDCLELVLTEYKQKIKDTDMMHASKEFPMTPLVYFLITLINKSVNEKLDKFIPLFLDAGADLNEPTIYGSVNEILRG